MNMILFSYVGIILLAVLLSAIGVLKKREDGKSFFLTLLFGLIGILAMFELTGW